MRLVLVESPFAGRGDDIGWSGMDADMNKQYALDLCAYLVRRGDAPYASHLFFTQFLDDKLPDQRKLGIEAGLAWGSRAELTVVGVDRGLSTGMRYGIERARMEGRPVEWLSLKAWRTSWLPAVADRAVWQELARPEDAVSAPIVGVSP